MSSLHDRSDERGHPRVAAQIEEAYRRTGFFYIRGHGVDREKIAAREVNGLPHVSASRSSRNRFHNTTTLVMELYDQTTGPRVGPGRRRKQNTALGIIAFSSSPEPCMF
ncbi:MAG TPA: hypothetical protein EYG08_03855 [Myxococcales bacterium]|nr:hypothetical protein [Myxococcales bacterium]